MTSIIYNLSKDTPDLQAILAGITHVHAACIEFDHTLATFFPPLSHTKMLDWWEGQFQEIINGKRHIWVELQPISSRKAQLESSLVKESPPALMTAEDHPGEIFEVAGVVSLMTPVTETGPFRAEVHKLLTSPNHRQKGIARRLMSELEKAALKLGRWNLMLDTEVGSPAESIYPRFGYIRIGMVPDYGYSPQDGRLTHGVWFYKDLKKQSTL